MLDAKSDYIFGFRFQNPEEKLRRKNAFVTRLNDLDRAIQCHLCPPPKSDCPEKMISLARNYFSSKADWLFYII